MMLKDTQARAMAFARTHFRRALSPQGAARADRLFQAGLTPALQPAFDLLYRGIVTPEDARVVARVEGFRRELVNRTEPIRFQFGNEMVLRSPRLFAHHASVTPEWGAFLYLAAKGICAGAILELGTSVGISGSYLASTPTCQKFTTIERSPDVAAVARGFITQMMPDAQVVTASFQDVLDTILESFGPSLDLYYVDGDHYYDSTLLYLEKAVPHLKAGALVIFDDIHWSKDMWRAWQVIREHAGFSYTIDVGRFGVCVWEGGSVIPQQHNLALYAGWLFTYTPRQRRPPPRAA
jgi:predicted O-methyltransferase YrrM